MSGNFFLSVPLATPTRFSIHVICCRHAGGGGGGHFGGIGAARGVFTAECGWSPAKKKREEEGVTLLLYVDGGRDTLYGSEVVVIWRGVPTIAGPHARAQQIHMRHGA